MPAKQESRQSPDDFDGLGAGFRRDAGAFVGSSGGADGLMLAMRVFGADCAVRPEKEITRCALYYEAKAYDGSSCGEYSVESVFGLSPEALAAKSFAGIRFKATEGFSINRDGAITTLSAGRILEIGETDGAAFRLTAQEALHYEKRGQIAKVG